MPYTSKVSSPGISIDTNNDGIIDGRVHQIKNAGNFNTFSITNGVLTVQGPTGGATIGGSDTHVQFNDGGAFAGESTLVYNKTSNTLSVSNLTVSDTLTVTTTTTLNSNTVTIGDAKIVLNSDFSGAGPTESAGFEVERGDEDNVNFIWNETNDNFEFQVGSNAAPVGKVGSIFATQTASSPTALTYSFASDTNTGIQHTGADQLGLVVGNARVLMVNASGVHINPSGASGASNALDVVGTATVTGQLDVDNISINGNIISSTDSNGHIQLVPNGVGDVFLQSDVQVGVTSSSSTQLGAVTTADGVAGVDLKLYGGSTGSGATANIAGGDLELQGGGGKGTGVGGNILFKVAPPGSSGTSHNSLATALTISGNDKSAIFEGAVTVNGNLTVSGTTTTVSSTTVSHADPVLQLNQGETNDANAGVTGSVSGFQVDRGSNSGTDIAITRFVWDDSVDAFRCQISNNAPTNSTFVDTQLRVGTPSDANDAATKAYVDAHVSTSITDADNNTKVQVEESADENKIRFDTAGSQRMIIDSNGRVGINEDSPDTMLHLTDSGAATPTITMENTGTETSEMELIFKRSGAGAASQDIGHIKWKALDSAGNQHNYGSVFVDAQDETTTTEDGRFIFMVTSGGSDNTEILRLSGSEGLVFNDSSNDLNFRVEGNSDENLLFTDAGNDKVGIGLNDPKTKLTVEGTLTLKEQSNAETDTAAYGQLWVKTATPNELYFTTDAGDDIRLTSGTSATGAGGTIGIANGEYLGANANVADNDFLRVDGTLIEGRTAAQTLSDIGAAPLTGAAFTGNVSIGGTATFVAPRAVVEDVAVSGSPLAGGEIELVRAQAGMILTVNAPVSTVHLPTTGANEIGDTYVVINRTGGNVTIDRSGLAGSGGHGAAQNLNGAASNGTLPDQEAVTLVCITADTFQGIGL